MAFLEKRTVFLIVIPVAVILFLAAGTVALTTEYYRDRVMPGVHIGKVAVGGMSREEVTAFLQSMSDKLVQEGFHMIVTLPTGKKEFVLYPLLASEGTTIELMRIDVDAEVAQLVQFHKQSNRVATFVNIARDAVTKPRRQLVEIATERERILAELKEELVGFEHDAQDAQLVITSLDPFTYEITPETQGVVFVTDEVVDTFVAAWQALTIPVVTLEPRVDQPTLTEQDIRLVADRVPTLLSAPLVELAYATDGSRKQWVLPASLAREWVTVVKKDDGRVVFGLDKERALAFVTGSVAPEIVVVPKDARFQIENNKVVEFQASRPGVEVDAEATYNMMNAALALRTYDTSATTTVPVQVVHIDPAVSTDTVNDLGITTILGSGTSNFAGSPNNRVRNIRNAVKKLNGILVAPGKEFSTIEYTKPYTLEGGYVPELVIKGDSLKPEIGGGLCQIGTTLFRMAMNSAMPITERRNHSLVVSYYNDPVSGFPGTDATVYEPAPDFKFLNDTGHYILVQTAINEKTGDLTFTLWGTSDGRKGSFTEPVVKRWIPYGEPRMVESDKLAPGEKNCQKAFRGAEASFTYIRELPDGTKEEKVFESYYRALPQICLVGKSEAILAPCPEGQVCDALPGATAPLPETISTGEIVIPVAG